MPAAVLLLGIADCNTATPVRQYGFALPAWTISDYQSRQAPSYVRDLAATGAGWIQLTPTWYQRDSQSSVMGRTEESASDASLRHIIRLAHASGLKVLLKPHLDLPDDGDRATIRPRDPDRWFTAYRAFIGHYADLAHRTGVEELAVGTELAGVSGLRTQWASVVSDVRSRYHGPLVYAANYDEYQQVSFWDLLDLIGIDAYWPLATSPTTSVPALRQAWRPIVTKLAAFAAQWQRQVLFTEAGYTSQQGSTVEPYSWSLSSVYGGQEQASAYAALLESFSPHPWWAGVHFWMWDDWPGSDDTPRKLAYSPHGKPAEQVARRWFR